MAKHPSEPDEVHLHLSARPEDEPGAARYMHVNAVAGVVYGGALRHRFASLFERLNLGQSAITYADDVMRRMAPRDPMEEMLVAQAMLAHARVLHLTDLANQQSSIKNIQIINEYTDRASNTFRRLMLALPEYRKPPRAGDSFTAIKQANIAGQQMVVNQENSETGNTTNEQGSSDEHTVNTHETRETPPALPVVAGGSGLPPGFGEADEAVGEVHRPKDGLGEESKSRMNAWKHGERSAEAMEERAILTMALRLLREEIDEPET